MFILIIAKQARVSKLKLIIHSSRKLKWENWPFFENVAWKIFQVKIFGRMPKIFDELEIKDEKKIKTSFDRLLRLILD